MTTFIDDEANSYRDKIAVGRRKLRDERKTCAYCQQSFRCSLEQSSRKFCAVCASGYDGRCVRP